MGEEASRANLVVSGRVQGVFYRASTMEQAQRLGLVGWVMNLADGGVEVLVEGPRYCIEELIAWCRLGPPLAKVTDVVVKWLEATGEFETFRVQ